MPFELGLDFGCRRFGAGRLARKVILVLEQERFRYQAAISDLAGRMSKHTMVTMRSRSGRCGTGSQE